MVDAGDDLIGRRDAGHADVGAVYVGRIVEHVLENALFDQDGSPAVAEVGGVRRGRYHPGASLPQDHLQPADGYVVGLFGDQPHAAAVVDGDILDQNAGRRSRVDGGRMPVLGKDAFERQDRSDGRQGAHEPGVEFIAAGSRRRNPYVEVVRLGDVVIVAAVGGGHGAGIENDVLARNTLFPAFCPHDELAVFDRMAELVRNLDLDTLRLRIRGRHLRLQREGNLPVYGEIAQRHAVRILDQKRDDPAVENEFRAAAVDLDVPPSRQRECEMAVSVVVVGDAVVFSGGEFRPEMVGAFGKYQFYRLVCRDAFEQGVDERSHVLRVVPAFVVRDIDYSGSGGCRTADHTHEEYDRSQAWFHAHGYFFMLFFSQTGAPVSAPYRSPWLRVTSFEFSTSLSDIFSPSTDVTAIAGQGQPVTLFFWTVMFMNAPGSATFASPVM